MSSPIFTTMRRYLNLLQVNALLLGDTYVLYSVQYFHLRRHVRNTRHYESMSTVFQRESLLILLLYCTRLFFSALERKIQDSSRSLLYESSVFKQRSKNVSYQCCCWLKAVIKNLPKEICTPQGSSLSDYHYC